MFYKKDVLKNVAVLRATVLEYLFRKRSEILKACNFIKKSLQHIPVNVAKFIEASIL